MGGKCFYCKFLYVRSGFNIIFLFPQPIHLIFFKSNVTLGLLGLNVTAIPYENVRNLLLDKERKLESTTFPQICSSTI